jgi:TnpA family transposase
VPVNFLTEEQRGRYGRFNADPDEAQLGGFFHLDAAARRRAMAAHGPRNQVGWAVQLGTVRFLGTFLPNPEDVPTVVVDYVAAQLGLEAADLKGYGERQARWDHQAQIRGAYGYAPFGPAAWLALARWLYVRAWTANERPSVLFDLATNRLVTAKVLLPGVTVLERLVAAIRDRAAARAFRLLAAAPSPAERARLERLVTVEAGRRVSELDRLRKSPTDVSGGGVVKALERYVQLRALGASGWDLQAVPRGRVAALARFAKAARAQAVAELATDRRLATLVAFAAEMEPTAGDEALEVVDLLVGDLVRRAGKQRLRTLKDLDAAALVLREAWLRLRAASDDPAGSGSLNVAFAALDLGRTDAAAATVGELAQQPDEDAQQQLQDRYLTTRRFLPRLLAVLDFDASGDGHRTLEALEFLRSIERRRSPIQPEEVPTAILTGAWQRRVFPTSGEHAGEVDKAFDKRAYTVAAVERLREELRRHTVFVPGLRKWGDPRAGLLAGEAWERARPQVCRDLDLHPEPGVDVARWAARLDGAYRQLADGLADNPAVRIEQRDGKDHLVLTGLDRLDEPASLQQLRAAVEARMPVVELPEALLEVHAWTGCLNEFTHVSEAPSRATDLTTSLAAVLVGQAMNVGMPPLVQDGNPALSLDRLFWVEQNYVRAQTLSAANAALVDYHAGLELAAAWGGGELASADGLRFVVPVRTINAGPNPKYFGRGKGAKGVTYYNFTSDQFTGFYGIVIPGTPKDWYYLLEGLLEQETSLHPVQVVADTAGASEMGFGVFRMLGLQLAPLLADAGGATLYRVDPGADYGPLQGLIRARVNTAIIADHWDDLLRVAGSLLTGAVKPAELLRYVVGGGRPTPVGRALLELGRLDRSGWLATYFDDELLRRRVGTQKNRQEARHSLARRIFHGQKGELRQRYREGQEDQLSALGFLVNVCVLWNTVYTARVLEAIRAEGKRVLAADVARLSPLGFEHLRFLGRYNFSLPEPVRNGQLRPLRTPAATLGQ